MGNIKPTQRIYDVVKEIKEEKFKLPSIQRSFVWEKERICKLFDSLTSDYPIGSFLVWMPPKEPNIRTKKFTADFKSSENYFSSEETSESLSYLVLDGQQRLQSLFIGFFGCYDKEYLYFKVDSKSENEENNQRYQFQFMTQEQAKQDSYWVRPKEIVVLKIEEISEYVNKKFSSATDDVKKIITKNLGIFIRIFNIDEKISFQDIKEDLPYNDVLEVFVRVNSGGIVLTKSDLVFSTVILNIPDMEDKFIELVDELNGGGEYEFDIDFIIKTSFVLFDKGAKYDVDKLKDDLYLDKLKSGFDDLKKALLSTIEFLKTNAKILTKRFLKSDLALIPIADFIYRQTRQQIPEGMAQKLQQYLYMSFFMKFFSYGPDGKLDVIHNKIKDEKQGLFPIEQIGKYLSDRTNLRYEFSTLMLNDLDLTLNIIQGGVSEIPRKRGWSLEKDHIFPQAFLKGKNIPQELINNVGNLRLINKTQNILKRDRLPEENTIFFGSSEPVLKKSFLNARKNFLRENFENFVRERETLIYNKVKQFLGEFKA